MGNIDFYAYRVKNIKNLIITGTYIKNIEFIPIPRFILTPAK